MAPDSNARRRALLLAAAALAVGGALAAPAGAQQADTARARADSAPAPLFGHAPIVASATRLPTPARRLGLSITTITSGELAAGRPTTVADALRSVAGAGIEEAVGPAGPAIVRLRGGEEVFTQVLMDGVVINQNGGFFDFQGLALTNVDRIEVVRGPHSALHGSSAVSGVVSMMTRAGAPGPLRLGFQGEGGGASEAGGSWSVGGNASGGAPAWRYSAAGAHAFERGYYALPHDVRTTEGALRVDGALGARVGLAAVARFAGVDARHPVRDAGATRVPLDPNAAVARDRLIGAVRVRLDSAGSLSHELAATGYREGFTYLDERDDVAPEGTFPFFVFDANLDFRSTLVRATAEYVGRWTPGAAGVAVAWGGQLLRESLRERVTFEGSTAGQRLERDGVAFFAEGTTSPLTRLTLTAGARYERFGDLASDVTPRASAALDLVPSVLGLRAAVGRAYKAPNLQQQYVNNPFIAGNPDLRPETSTSVEAGLDLRVRGSAALAFTVFQQSFDDLIRTVALAGTEQQINRNLGASEARGVEWELRWLPRRAWLIGLDGSLVDTEVIDNSGLSATEYPTGEALPFRPDVIAGAFAQLPVGPRLGVRLRGQYIGEQVVLTERFSGERRTLDGYFTVGLNLTFAARPGLDLYVRADNVLNAGYETAWDRAGAPARAAIGFAWHAQ